MTRFEMTTAVQSALRQTDRRLTLVAIRALPFAWELRLEDADGVERVMTIHHGSVASTLQRVTNALQCCV
jgi:type IV secretory pathway ATPase VirB11/archaellum biosynthesis ATPase